ncbi:MarR family winged helix-turn-helix transcriptional regulator [Ornithinicoccus halotolerans]|uniref:MarR family winged helix-turn-helix transcriptional regulator n=1 Tax=Ornithinicoccus halotolerans TaxID=1748220 RepID=UPI00129497E4|nr:MarR family winged helix-turn-helix transcriptional regulator [Ornithinicoccus halotolerans]
MTDDSLPGPTEPPIGRALWDAVTVIARRFEETLAAAGGSRSMWWILLALVRDPGATQREIAGAVGIKDATLTHHLAGMEDSGLIVRRRCERNRRAHTIELTTEGHAAFRRLQQAALGFDRQLRGGVSAEELRVLRDVLDRLVANATRPPE